MSNYFDSYSPDVPTLLAELRKKREEYWIRSGEVRALKLFHKMAERVPAYKDFLQKKRFKADSVQTAEDFKSIPTIDKQSYLQKYSLDMLSWDGKLAGKQNVISTTSGSTGEPFYFPRTEQQDVQYALVAELYLRTNFQIHKKSTLYIVGFMMGAWIGGLFTYSALQILAKRGMYDMSVITPGVDKAGIINAVKKLGPYFDQIIIGSYAPFLKDVLDDGVRLGLDWKKYNLHFVFSAEGFSEEVRDYVVDIAGNKNIYTATLNHYGTVDLGTMSYETPVSILARRTAIQKRDIYERLFGVTNKLPTLTQYIPELFYFEEIDRTVICSAYSGLPLVRYDLKDIGGIFGFEKLKQLFAENGADFDALCRGAGIESTVWNLPFVYVFERNDFMVKFYLCDVYPETVKKALQRKDLERLITGKFTMMIKFNKNRDQYLEINIELKARVKETRELKNTVTRHITDQLLHENEGYRQVYKCIGKRAIAKIVFWPYEDPEHFRPGTKQQWVKRESKG